MRRVRINRTSIINWIISKKGYESYLEIGVHRGKNFKNINIKNKVGVDPLREPTFKMTSDQFFKQNKSMFDIIFIDGLHHKEQVLNDIINSSLVLNPGGIILIHDCLPSSEECQTQNREVKGWTGDCWKAFAELRATKTNIEMFTINADHGIGVIRFGLQVLYTGSRETYNDFITNKQEMMNIVSWKEAAFLIGSV